MDNNVPIMSGREAMLRSSQQRYQMIFEESPKPMWLWDTTTRRIIEVNEAAQR